MSSKSFSFGDYNAFSAAELVRRLPELDLDTVEQVLDHERGAKGRVTIIRRAEQLLSGRPVVAAPPLVSCLLCGVQYPAGTAHACATADPGLRWAPPPPEPLAPATHAWPAPTAAVTLPSISQNKQWYQRRWVQVAAAVFGVLMLIGALAPDKKDERVESAAPSVPTPTESSSSSSERAPTTSTTQPTTTTTQAPTTTTAPPTTVPPTTAPPTTAAPKPFVAPAPDPAPSCTPGYDPCIPPGGDVDCASGSGNGPRYVNGPVFVSGSDPYDLDRDGDGVGCD